MLRNTRIEQADASPVNLKGRVAGRWGGAMLPPSLTAVVALGILLSSALHVFARSPTAAREATPGTAPEEQPALAPALAYPVVMLARDPAVQGELQLSDQQTDAVNDAVAEIDQPLWVLRDVPAAKGGDRLDQLLSKFQRRLQDSLLPAQLDRLNELVLRVRGYKALASPDVAKRLKLSQQQISKIKRLLTDAEPKQADPKKILGILSAQQKATFSQLVGTPFDLDRVTWVGVIAPELRGVSAWFNTRPLTLEGLRGKVVLVHFWTFGCINCVHNLPHYQSWYEKFPKSRLEIIGIHTPETENERSVDKLRGAIAERGIEYPVVMDLEAANWKAWGNDVWPSVYVVDKKGRVRYWWYGELNWKEAKGEGFMRKKVEELLAEK
ncbi:MAG TPA: redoxin domain-containing protein [Pirellulales bacterium]|jgi:thiol-disulfide isomerase/thioredoxin|nr:redoxin domain-containing protein [Pirellulales bacterium]